MGVPAINPKDPYRFIDGQDQLYLAGYYPGLQALIVGPGSGGDWYQKLIDRLAQNRINLLRVTLTFGMALTNYQWRHPYQLTDQCCSYVPPQGPWRAGFKFDLDHFDEDFFSYWSRVVRYAGDRGVVVQACLLDGAHTDAACTVNGYGSNACDSSLGSSIWGPFQIFGLAFDYYFKPNSIQGVVMGKKPTDQWYSDRAIVDRQQAFVEKAVETLGGYDRLIWELINEPAAVASVAEGQGPTEHAMVPRDSLDGQSWIDFMTRTVRDAEKRNGFPAHLIIPADLPNHKVVAGQKLPVGSYNSNRTACSGSNTFTLGKYQEFRDALRRPLKDYPQGAPLVSDNDFSVCPGPVKQLPLWQRRKAWTSFVGGGYASLFVFDLFIEPPWNPMGLDNPAVVEGMRFVGLTRRFVDDFQIDLAGTVPQKKALNNDQDTAWSLAQEVAGQLRPYVVYFFQQCTATIASLASPDACEWFDPRTGKRSNAGGDYSDSVFSTPASGEKDQDWVLHIPAVAWS